MLFHALVRWVSPILCFTAEEVWRDPLSGRRLGPLLETWPEIDAGWRDDELAREVGR